jgi:hypothetical protein
LRFIGGERSAEVAVIEVIFGKVSKMDGLPVASFRMRRSPCLSAIKQP